MVSKKSLSMRLKIQRIAAATPSLENAPKSKAPTRLKSGQPNTFVGMTAVASPNGALSYA